MNPGSLQAIKNGCTCPVLDNGHGRGHLGDGEKFGWWINAGCPLHGQTKSPENGEFEEERLENDNAHG